MKIRYFFLRLAVLLVSVFLLYVLETSVFNHLALAGVTPDLLLALTSLTGFIRGRKEGMAAGLLSGLLLDTLSGQIFGMYALIFLLLGFLNGLFRHIFFGDDIRLPILFVGLTDILYGTIIYLLFFLPRGRSSFRFCFTHIMLPEALYTILISFLLYFFILKISAKIDKTERKGERRFV